MSTSSAARDADDLPDASAARRGRSSSDRVAALAETWSSAIVAVGDLRYRCHTPNTPPPRGAGVFLTTDEPDARPTLSDAETRRRRVELRQILDERGLPYDLAVGSSPDGRHSERGVIIWGVPEHQWRELAARYDQVAVFVLEADGSMRVVLV